MSVPCDPPLGPGAGGVHVNERCRPTAPPSRRLAEDDRAVVDDENAVFQVRLDGTGEDDAFEVPAAAHQGWSPSRGG